MSNQDIKRIKVLQDNEVAGFNLLLDEGSAWDTESGAQFLANDDNALFIAYSGKELVGFLTAHHLQRFDKRKSEILLYEIGVREDHQRKGIGTQLIQEVKKWAKEIDADLIWVVTNRSNKAAMGLYLAAGGRVENDDEQVLLFSV